MSQTTFLSHHGMLLNAYFGGGPQGESRDGIPLGLLSAQAAAAGPDEVFFVDEVGTGLVTLRSINGYYVCAEGGGGHELVANRIYDGEVGPWEIFKLTILDGAAGAVALQTHSGARRIDHGKPCVPGGAGPLGNVDRVDALVGDGRRRRQRRPAESRSGRRRAPRGPDLYR
jgi:hypothetical protein